MRWYHAFGGHLRTLLETCHQNLLPAIDRASVEAYQLHSLAQYEDQPICNISTSLIAALNNDLDVLRMISNDVVEYAADEAHRMHIFADWLLSQHLRLHDPGSPSAKEAERKIAETDYPQLLAYIQGGLFKSSLDVFFGHNAENIAQAPRRPRTAARREIVDAMLKRHAKTPLQPAAIVEYVNLRYISHFIGDTSAALLKHVRDTAAKASTADQPPDADQVLQLEPRNDELFVSYEVLQDGRLLVLSQAEDQAVISLISFDSAKASKRPSQKVMTELETLQTYDFPAEHFHIRTGRGKQCRVLLLDGEGMRYRVYDLALPPITGDQAVGSAEGSSTFVDDWLNEE